MHGHPKKKKHTAKLHVLQQQKLEPMKPQGGGRQLGSREGSPYLPTDKMSELHTEVRGTGQPHRRYAPGSPSRALCRDGHTAWSHLSCPATSTGPGEGLRGKQLSALTFRPDRQGTSSKA